MKIGWQLVGAPPDNWCGGDESSWSYDGHLEEKMHSGIEETYGKICHPGDVVGVFLDLADRTISENYD